MNYDLAAVRAQFPALAEGAAHFDGPGGSQVARPVADAVAATLMAAVANRGHRTLAERRAERIVLDARQAMADLLGVDPRGVVFGRSMTALAFDFARTLARTWQAGDEVVVTRLDHDANIRPWVVAAGAVGAEVRWADFDRDTGDLPVEAVTRLLSPRTRLVAVTGASNLLGTRPDVAAIAAAAHEVGALVHVDGVHLTPHAPVDVAALGADLYSCSPYKFLGPHLGVMAGDPALLEQLHPDKLLPSTDAVPERFELGTLPYELLAGVTATVDFLASITGDTGPRRTRVLTAMSLLEAHESALAERLEAGLRDIDGVRLLGSAPQRTPTVAFTVAGRSPQEIAQDLADVGVNAPASHFYAIEASRWLGLGDDGAVRAGIAPYNDSDDVDRLLRGVATAARR
ncbi:cysteine desulfurase-like protein [Egicoccus halophilus]|uniref:Cysteine desulfurase-like protein n=1 Tax=Egicoccus halophilus TaxID=1670830 RepID=A0A8J3EQW0_9ACTN|nr:cysteine desulfurase-like protein [Egicoccus halophilus]